MKKILYSVFLLTVFFGSEALADPVPKGSYTIPSAHFGSLKSIIDTLNAFGIAGGTAPDVTINLTDNEALGPYILGSCVLNASAVPIIINGGGFALTAHNGTGSTDAIFMVQGTDNVTIKNFVLVESAANTTATTMMEWGIAGVKLNSCGSIDGVQTLNILDCNITLNKTNGTAAGGTAPAGTSGIFLGNNTAISRTALLAPTSADGANRFFYFKGNKITNVNHGIWCMGLRATIDGTVNNDAFLTLESNTITNFTHNGIAISYFNNDIVQTSIINNMSDGGTAPTANNLFGIRYVNDPTLQTNASWTCTKNGIDLTMNTSDTIYSGVGIMSQIYGTGTTDINTDTIKLTSSGVSALLVGIFSQNKQGTQTIGKNQIKDFTTQITNKQAVIGIYAGGYAVWAGIGVGDLTLFPTTCTVSENTLENFSISSGTINLRTTPNRCGGILWDNFTIAPITVSKNTVKNFTINASCVSRMTCIGSVFSYGPLTAATPSYAHTTTVSDNTISNIVSSGNATSLCVFAPLGAYPNWQTFVSSKNKIDNVKGDSLVVAYLCDYSLSYSLDKDTISNIGSNYAGVYGLLNASTNTSSVVGTVNIYSSKTINVKNCSFTSLKSNGTVTLSASGQSAALAMGLNLQAGTISGYQFTEGNINNNIFRDITTSEVNSVAIGVNVQTTSAAMNMSNNIMSDIAAPSNKTAYNSSYGIWLQNTGANTILYNTVNMASAGASGYGASGIAYNPAGSNTLKNNIIRVDIAAGTGNNVAAMRGLTGAASAAPSLTAFAASSNIYHTPQGPNNYLYVEGTTNASLINGFSVGGLTANTTKNIVNDKFFNSDCKKSLYHNFMQGSSPTRENKTYTENNLSGSAGIYAPATGQISYAESNATDVAVATDIKGDPRPFGASDIGAMEFNGKQIPVITVTISSSTGFDTACPYNLPTLTATVPDYFKDRVQYQWYRGTTVIVGAVSKSLVVTPVSGIYYITVYDTVTGCTDTSDTYKMTIVPPPPAIITYYDSLTFCETSAIVIQANKGPRYTYRWFFNGGPIAGETNDHLVVDKTGEYSLEVNTPLGCASNSAPIRVKVYPLPTPTVFSDGPQRLKTEQYFTYQWYRNNVKIDDTDAVGQTLYIQSKWGDGAYSVEVTDSNGCTSKSDVYLYSILGLDNTTAATIKVYPNPATDRLYIESSMPGVQAQLTDLAGRVIIKATHAKVLDMSALAEGMYLLTLSDEEGKQIKVQKINKTK